jgi:hypothetical protein
MCTFFGTNHFRSTQDAVNYYKPYAYDHTDVKHKIEDKEIMIGRPGGCCSIDKDGRYWAKGVKI